MMKTAMPDKVTVAIIFMACMLFYMPAAAEDIEKTIKYQAPTIQQTTDFIEKKTLHSFAMKEAMLSGWIEDRWKRFYSGIIIS